MLSPSQFFPDSQVEFLLCRFSPGVGNDPAPSTGTMKRRTQSLSALPKDGDRKVGPPCRQPENQRPFIKCLHLLFFVKTQPEGEGPHPPPHERIHDLQQTPPCPGAPATPQPGQPDSQQDPGGVVVRAGAQREAAVPRSGFPGSDSLSFFIDWGKRSG